MKSYQYLNFDIQNIDGYFYIHVCVLHSCLCFTCMFVFYIHVCVLPSCLWSIADRVRDIKQFRQPCNYGARDARAACAVHRF